MPLSKDQKLRISEVVKAILLSRLESFPDLDTRIRNAPFHELFLKAFEKNLQPFKLETPYLVALASWMHGLNTSLGTGFENLAHIVSGGYKRQFTSTFTLPVKNSQAHCIDTIIRELKSSSAQPNIEREEKLIFSFTPSDNEVKSLGFTADNYCETDKLVNAIEIKSVRPNSGEGRGEKQKILYGKAAFKLNSPKKIISFKIAFPFDPTSDNPVGFDKERFFNYLVEFKKFFDPDEVLIGPEFWDYLSHSKNTMPEILDIIKETVSVFKK